MDILISVRSALKKMFMINIMIISKIPILSCVYKGLSRSLRSRGFDLKYKEAHHWDYDCLKSGFILSRRAHKLIHKYLKLDNENRFFFYGENLIDTKEKHRIFMDKIFEINNVDYKYVEFDL